MKRIIILPVICSIFVLASLNSYASDDIQASSKGWKAGVASVVITPEQSMWLAGYSARDHPSEGTLVDLWSKALVIEDAKGKKVVLITNDLESVPKNVSDKIRNRIEAKYGLTRSQIILNCSHTHSGPVLYDTYSNGYNLGQDQLNKVKAYSEKYENQIIDLVDKAIRSMVEVKIYSQNGITRFQVNRRNNDERTLNSQTELKGPNDYAVPVIKVVNTAGDLIAVAFGYACHNTVLDTYKWSGDYAGYAQIELEKSYPGITSLFFQGAGADQNPLPRRTVPLAQQYGQELAAAVERVLNEDMKLLNPQISTAYSEIELPYTDLPAKDTLIKIAEKSSIYPDWHKKWASDMLDKIRKGEKIRTSYPNYPCQIWKLGDQAIMVLGGELVIEYAIRLKQIFGQDTFVLGYSNDVNDEVSYIPSVTILKEGGYEGLRSHLSSGLPGTYKPDIESIILQEMIKLAEKTGIPQSVNNNR
jgi:neutral ceramidase